MLLVRRERDRDVARPPTHLVNQPEQLLGAFADDPAPQEQAIMTIHHPVIGCDVSMAHLDLFDAQHKASQRIENSAQAIDQWLQTVCDRKPFVVFEATGSYDLQLRRCLDSAGIAFTRVNPVKARNFARATGILAKTDKVDAAMLASLGQSLALQPDLPSCPQKQRLDELSTHRDQLVAMRKQEQTRLKQTHDEDLRHDIKSHIDQLSERTSGSNSNVVRS